MSKQILGAIMQPTYNPWIGYFDMIDKVDKFVFLDDVQLVKQSWQVRNRIKTANGEQFLIIPVIKNKGISTLIKEAVIRDNKNWRKKHLKALELNYKKSRYFEEIFPFLENLINNNIITLGDFNANIIQNIARKIGIKDKFVLASELLNISGKKDERLANICKELKINVYLSPQGAATYLEQNSPGGFLVKNNIDLYYHNYEHPIYKQLYGEFIPYMGIFDLLFNNGFKNALSIIRKGRKQDIHYMKMRKKINLTT